MTLYLKELGVNLRNSRKKSFPKDTMAAFALRCEIGLSTYKKMESGELTVSLNQYYKAAVLLGQQSAFHELFKMKEDWFNV